MTLDETSLRSLAHVLRNLDHPQRLRQTALTGVSTPVYCALTTTGDNLWSSDFTGNGSVPEFHYPKGGFRFAQVNPGVETVGIAVTPAETP